MKETDSGIFDETFGSLQRFFPVVTAENVYPDHSYADFRVGKSL